MGAYGSPDLTNNNSSQPKAYCRFCGRALYENTKKCPDCKKKQDKSRWYLWLIIILLLPTSCSMESVPYSTNEFESNITQTETDKNVEPVLSETEFKEKCEVFNYKDIARNPQSYKGKYMKFKGEVIQTMESGKNLELRMNSTCNEYGYYEDTIYATYKYSANESKILEEDIITVYGIYQGDITYTSVLGSSVTIPNLEVHYWALEK